jgi:excisionase family DNA binding protein
MLTEAQADGPRMLRRREVRRRLGIGKEKFLELVNTGQLPAIRAGGAPNSPFLISETDLQDFIDRNRVKPVQAAS